MTGGGGRSRSKRDTPEPDTPIREKMPIGEAGESFPQLVDSSVEFSTRVDSFHPHVWKTPVHPVLRKAAVRLHFGGPLRLVGSFASTGRLLSAKAKGLSWALCAAAASSPQRPHSRRLSRRGFLRGSCGAEFVSEARGRIVSAVRRAARSTRFGVERKGISRPGDVSVCTASPPERRGGPQGE